MIRPLLLLAGLALGGCCGDGAFVEYHNDNGARGREDLTIFGGGRRAEPCAPAPEREPRLAPVK